MKQNLKNAAPVLFGVLVLLTVEIINLWGIVPLRQSTNFETMSNFLLLAVALVSLFLQGLPSIKSGRSDLSIILSNIAVSAIAFPMNIDVFKHSIRLEYLLEDFWGWHGGWLLFAFVQILALTGLGSKLNQQIKALFSGIKGISKKLETGLDNAGKKLGAGLDNASKKLGTGMNNAGKKLGDFGSYLSNTMRRLNKRKFAIIFTGILLWAIYLWALCYSNGVYMILSDLQFWINSLRLWIYYFIVIFILHIIFTVFQKAKEAVLEIDSKLVVLTAALFIVLVILVSLMPILSESLTIVFILIITVGLLWVSIKKMKDRNYSRNSSVNNGVQTGNLINDKSNLKYVSVLVISFVVIPLTILLLETIFGPDGKNFISSDPDHILSILDFFSAVSKTADNLLKQLM